MVHRPAPTPPYHHRQPTSIGNILLRTFIANMLLLLVALFISNNPQYASVAIFVLTLYPFLVFLESLYIYGMSRKYLYFGLSFGMLLIVALITTLPTAGIVRRIGFPESLTQWHFYVYFPLIGPLLSYKLSARLFRID